MKGYIYILTNSTNKVLYTGVTSDIINRLNQHKDKKYRKSFSARYNLDKLVYFEEFDTIGDAIKREKQIKGDSRNSKIKLISDFNPKWNDLYTLLVEE